MGFRQAASGAAAPATRPAARGQAPARAATKPKVPGGRYAGIKAAQPSAEKLKRGQYIIEFVRSAASRTGSTLMLYVKVIENNEDPAATRIGEEALVMINTGGKSYDSGMSRVKQLTVAVCDCADDDELDVEEPDWGDLIDAMFGEAEGVKAFGANPLAGKQVYCTIQHSTSLDENGEPYQNSSWERLEEAAPF